VTTRTEAIAPRPTPPDGREAADTARDSMTVALWTAISRGTGLVRVVVVAAVLGPTFLGNTYQFTNSVPNLVYYGFLGGSLVSSLLVPALVRHISAGDRDAIGRMACGFIGAALVAALIVMPIAATIVPFVLRVGTWGTSPDIARAQTSAAVWLVFLLMPQVACYAIIASSVAVMNAHKRFALAAAGPALENVGILLVLAATAMLFGSNREVNNVDVDELLLLGCGTTGAVIAHAALQWWGARRVGVTLRPRPGWRNPEVRAVLRRAVLAILQAGLWSLQLLVMLAFANRVPGGVVAVLVAMNFFFLPIALGATPIALSALPRLAEHAGDGRATAFGEAFDRAIALTLFVTVPATAGYLLLARDMGRLIAFGPMDTPGAYSLIAGSLGAVAIGIVGTGVFTVATYASYAREDATAPLRAMALQAGVVVLLMTTSAAVAGGRSLVVLGASLSVGTLTGAVILVRHVRTGAAQRWALTRVILRASLGSIFMAVPVLIASRLIDQHLSGRGWQVLALASTIIFGTVVYVFAQWLLRAPELRWLLGGLHRGRWSSPAASTSGRTP